MQRPVLITAVLVGGVLAIITQVIQSVLPGSEAWPLLNALLGSLFLLLLAFVAVGGVTLFGASVSTLREKLALAIGIGLALMLASSLAGLLAFLAPGLFLANSPLTQALDRLGTFLGLAGAFLIALAVWARLSRSTQTAADSTD